MPRPKRKFKVGHMYAIDYDDHYSTEKAYREEEDGGPMKLRARGVVLLETAKTVVIEYSVHVSDRHASNKRSDRHGIVKSCIVKVQYFGPERMDK